jgi:hypothetical protein
MKRFESDDTEDIDLYKEEQDYENAMSKINIEFYKIEQESDRRLLFLTVKILEKSFFWRFRSHMSKLKIINRSYQILKNIINTDKGV